MIIQRLTFLIFGLLGMSIAHAQTSQLIYLDQGEL